MWKKRNQLRDAFHSPGCRCNFWNRMLARAKMELRRDLFVVPQKKNKQTAFGIVTLSLKSFMT